MASNSAQGIYVPSLIVQDHGYPLWLPDPFSNVPPNNVRPGTQVGDLGYLTEDGGFVYLFNVCKDANDPVNLGRVPPDFAPVTGIPVLNSIRENKFIHDKNSAISTNAVRHKAFGFDVSLGVPDIPVPVGATCGFEITNSSSTAAALILPNGGERYDSEHRGLFRVYATSNAHSWYKYFNGVQGRDIRNGTLYLVTGCDKCYSFANMCYSHPSSSNSVSLKFWVTDALTFTGTGRRGWDVEPSVHTRHRDREPGTTDANYTIFLRGYTISVREESSVPVMAGMPSTSVLPATSGKKAQHFGPEFPYSSTLQRSTEQAATRTGTSGDTQGYDVGMESTLRLPKFDDSKIIEGSSHEYPGSRVSEFSEGNLEPDISVMGIPYADTLVQQLPGQDKISNPSAFINEYILDNYSGATVALTHDDFKWMGVENNVKNPLDVVELAKYAIEKKLVLIRQSETTPTAWVAQREDQDIVGGPLTPITPAATLSDSALTETALETRVERPMSQPNPASSSFEGHAQSGWNTSVGHSDSPNERLFALLFGVDKYKNKSPNFRNLNGAVADAMAVYEFLEGTLDIPAEKRIKIFCDEEVTRARIETEIEGLGNNPAIKKDDPILIFYAGHGATAKAPSTWSSANGTIQMLAPHDFNPEGDDPEGVFDIKLHYLLAALAAKKSDNITVILDCCYSGSATRAGENDSIVRGIKLLDTTISEDRLRGFEPLSGDRGSGVANGFETEGLTSHVLLSACKATQKARETGGHGHFTSALLDYLRTTNLNEFVYADIPGSLPVLRSSSLDSERQDPQCKGAHKSRYLFTTATNIRHPIHASPDTPGLYILEAGEVHGFRNGDQFVVYASRNPTAQASMLGTVTISRTTASTAECVFSGPGGQFKLGYAEPARRVHGHLNLALDLDEGLTAIWKKGKELEGRDKFHLMGCGWDKVPEGSKPDLVVTISQKRDKFTFGITDEDCRRYGLEWMPRDSRIKIDDLDTIRCFLQRSLHFYYHLRRSSKTNFTKGTEGKQNVTLQCKKLKPTTGSGYTSSLQQAVEPFGDDLNKDGVIKVDADDETPYTFKITNHTNVDLYVSVFYFDMSNLSIHSYYQPGSAGTDTNAEPSVPARGSLVIGYGEGGAPPRKYFLREGQTVDVGFLKLFITTRNVDLSGIAQETPFDPNNRADAPWKPVPPDLWDTMCFTVVQKQKSK